MTDMPKPACGNCRFAFLFNGVTLCRRLPPQVFIVGTLNGQPLTQALYANVLPDMWCGEHKPTAKSLASQGDVVRLPPNPQ